MKNFVFSKNYLFVIVYAVVKSSNKCHGKLDYKENTLGLIVCVNNIDFKVDFKGPLLENSCVENCKVSGLKDSKVTIFGNCTLLQKR